MKIVLIDDEPIALEVLESMLSGYEGINIAGSYTDPLRALDDIEFLKPDVIFLDIEMGKVGGLEAAEHFLEKLSSLRIVFVTGYSEYAIHAFEMNALDYLLKPVSKNRLDKTIERLRKPDGENILTAAENLLDVHSFGGFVVLDSYGQPLRWRTRKTKELFAYLYFRSGQFTDKAVLMDAVFPDKNLKQGSALLHTTVYQLRNSLKSAGFPNPIAYLNQGYRLNIPLFSDLEELKKLLKAGELSASEMNNMLKIYKGDFMEEGYNWAVVMQQSLKQSVFETVINFASSNMGQKEFGSLIKSCLELLYEIDPYNEGAARLKIIYYGEQSSKEQLKLFYRDYALRLKNEMDIEPSADLKILYDLYMV
jgi:two-component SAPR family response regulator